MKKVAFMFVAAMALSFAACGGQTKASEECDSTACDSAVVEEVVVEDSAAADTVVAEAAEVVAE
jgi:hypothetical protein